MYQRCINSGIYIKGHLPKVSDFLLYKIVQQLNMKTVVWSSRGVGVWSHLASSKLCHAHDFTQTTTQAVTHLDTYFRQLWRYNDSAMLNQVHQCVKGLVKLHIFSSKFELCSLAVYNHWTGMMDWTGGLTLKSIFMASNRTQWPVGLYDTLC